MTEPFSGPVELVAPSEAAEHAERYAEAAERYRRLRDEEGGGEAAGDREPRDPLGPAPKLGAEAEP